MNTKMDCCESHKCVKCREMGDNYFEGECRCPKCYWNTHDKFEICDNCRHFRILKELVGGEWKYRNCCILMAKDEGGFVIPVDENDTCEEFEV